MFSNHPDGDGRTNNLSQWLDSKFLGFGPADQDERASTVVQVRGIGGGNNPIRLENGLEGWDLVKFDLFVFLVLLDDSFDALRTMSARIIDFYCGLSTLRSLITTGAISFSKAPRFHASAARV